MAIDDDRLPDDAPPDHGATRDPGAPRGRPRRRWVPLLAVVAPVVAVAVLLGVRAAGTGALDVDAARAAVDEALVRESAARDLGDGGWTFSGGADPERSLHGSSGVPAPGPGPHELTIVCASDGGAPVHVTVRLAGETAAEAVLPCSDARRPGDEPAVTSMPTGVLDAGWAFRVDPETRAVLAVLMSSGGAPEGAG